MSPLRTVLAVVVAAGLVVSPAFGQEAPEREGASSDTTASRLPTRAMVRSLLLPGWGQFYNKRIVKGGVIAAAEIASAAAVFVEANRAPDPVTGVVENDRTRLFVLTTAGILFYSIVDAYVDAHLDMVDWGKVEADSEARGVKVSVEVRW